MDDPFNGPIYKFQGLVNNLRTELENLSRDHVIPDDDPQKLRREYQIKILPNLLQIRKINRIAKEKGEEKSDKLNEFNKRLVGLKEKCDSITFEAACLKHEVVCAKKRLSPRKARDDGDAHMNLESNGNETNFFDVEEVGQLDHEKRLEVIDREEAKRRTLQERLAEATAETNEIGLVCEDSSAQLNRLKPYIRQLLDKVDLGEPVRKD